MPTTSAGLLLYRATQQEVEVLLVHPGGPFWARKDLGAWSIPKGEVSQDEDLWDAAQREFSEETGFYADGPAIPLGHTRQRGGKIVHVWAACGDADCDHLCSNTFEMEWPPGSERYRSFPEVDKAAWFDLEEARRRILPAQEIFLDRLVDNLKLSSL